MHWGNKILLSSLPVWKTVWSIFSNWSPKFGIYNYEMYKNILKTTWLWHRHHSLFLLWSNDQFFMHKNIVNPILYSFKKVDSYKFTTFLYHYFFFCEKYISEKKTKQRFFAVICLTMWLNNFNKCTLERYGKYYKIYSVVK